MKYEDLVKNTPKVSKGTTNNVDQSARVRLNDIVLQKGVRTETFYLEVGSSSKGSSYGVMIMFKGIDDHQGLSEEEIAMGLKPKPSLSKNDIAVRCNCPSYRFRFDYANRGAKAATGAKFPAYHKLTNRAPNNPDNIPGVCKHIMEAMDYLISNGFVNA
jgi:hypothetical protein